MADTTEIEAGVVEAGVVEAGVVEQLKTVFDPEIPVNIYELGLIYDVEVEPTGNVHIKMTLTSPGCPVAGSLPIEVQRKVEGVPGVAAADVELVWDPAWNPSMMSEAARLQLGMF
jgi:FeS assembly SUF system protein